MCVCGTKKNIVHNYPYAPYADDSDSLIGLTEQSSDNHTLCDVWDGAVLREGVTSGRFSGGALSMSTDGPLMVSLSSNRQYVASVPGDSQPPSYGSY